MGTFLWDTEEGSIVSVYCQLRNPWRRPVTELAFDKQHLPEHLRKEQSGAL